MTTEADGSRAAKVFARAATADIWLGPTQQAGLTHLCAGTQVKVLIGPSSCGKTTLLRHFQHHLTETLTLHIPGPHHDASQVLSALLKAASLETTDLTKTEQRNLLRVFFERRRLLGTRVIVCADDVSGFSEAAWNEIESLLALCTSNKPLVELALVGTQDDATHSCLRGVVEAGSISAVEGVRYLSPPSDEDIRRYINWQLERINVKATFSTKAYSRINELSENRFAAVNDLCDTIISATWADGARNFDVGAVNRAADSLAESYRSTEPLPISIDEGLTDRLVISRNGHIERIVHLNRQLLIGRGESSDLKLASPYLSRHHAMISSSGNGRFTIVDLNSSNGVLVNGTRVKFRKLRNGDTVQLAQYKMKLIAAAEADKTDRGPASLLGDAANRFKAVAQEQPEIEAPVH